MLTSNADSVVAFNILNSDMNFSDHLPLINFKNLKFTLRVRTIITLRKQQQLFLHDFVAISARQLLLFVNTSPYPNNRAVLPVIIF